MAVSDNTRQWPVFPLGEVADILDSRRIPVNAKERANRTGNIPYYGATGQVGWIDDHIFDEELVLLGEDGAPFLDDRKPKAYMIRGKAWVNNHAHVLRAKPGLLNSFLMHQLNRVDYAPFVSGTTRLKLPQAPMRRIPLVIPPLDQQRRVVAELEKHFTRSDAGVSSLSRVRESLKRYRSALLCAAFTGNLVITEAEKARDESRSYEPASIFLSRILEEHRRYSDRAGTYAEPPIPSAADVKSLPEGWVWCMSDALFSVVTSGSRGWAKYYSDGGPIFLRVGNLDHETIQLDLANIQHVTPPEGVEAVRTRIQAGDILISITADVGMVAVVPEGLGEAYINQHLALARPLPSVIPAYLGYYLSASEGGWRHFRSLQRGATKAGLGLADIRNVPVPLAPVAEQDRIVTELDRRLSTIDELEKTLAITIDRTVRLHRSILESVFPSTIGDEPDTLLQRAESPEILSEDRQQGAPGPLDLVLRHMKKPKKKQSLFDVLAAHNGRMTPEELFYFAGFSEADVDQFFEELKREEDAGRIRQLRPDNTKVIIESVRR